MFHLEVPLPVLAQSPACESWIPLAVTLATSVADLVVSVRLESRDLQMVDLPTFGNHTWAPKIRKTNLSVNRTFWVRQK